MMSTNGMRPIHPGEILREEYLAPLGMSVNALAGALHVPTTRMNDIVRERRGVTADTALRLARYFGTTERYWLNLQTEGSHPETPTLRDSGTGSRRCFGATNWLQTNRPVEK